MIYENKINQIERYCHNCGHIVIFKDSLKRRQNANGKMIYHFAIYKCPKGHTWNQTIESFKTKTKCANLNETIPVKDNQFDMINLADYKKQEIERINIYLDVFEINERMDKFLSSKLNDVSRNEVTRLINNGMLLLNGCMVKSNKKLKSKDMITIITPKITE